MTPERDARVTVRNCRRRRAFSVAHSEHHTEASK